MDNADELSVKAVTEEVITVLSKQFLLFLFFAVIFVQYVFGIMEVEQCI